MSEQGKLPIAWSAMPALIGHAAIAFGLTLIVPLAPFVPSRLGALCRSALARYAPEMHLGRRRWSAGVCLLAYTIPLFWGVCVAWSMREMGEGLVHDFFAEVLLPVALPVAIGSACAPLALAPFVVLHDEAPVLEALRRSFELSARRGAIAALGDGAIAGGMVGVVTWSEGPLGAIAGEDAAGKLLALLAAWLTGLPFTVLLLARAYVEATRRPAFDPARHRRVGRAIAVSGLAIAPALVAVLAAALLATATPSPMRQTPPSLLAQVEIVARPGPGRASADIPGPHGIRVSRVPDGIVIATADGGGAGHVRQRPHRGSGSERLVIGRLPGEREVYGAFLDPGDQYVIFDREGVRLDDGLGARLASRLEGAGLFLFALALALAASLAHRILSAFEEAAALDSPDAADLLVRKTVGRISLTAIAFGGTLLVLAACMFRQI